MTPVTKRLPALIRRNEPVPARQKAAAPPRRSFAAILATGLVACLAGVLVFGVGSTFVGSLMRHIEHERVVHPDGTVAHVINAVRGPAKDVGLVYRLEDGTLRRVLVERSRADAFVNEMLADVEKQRAAAKADASADLERAFALAFADGDRSIEAYADWFYEWKRSYILLKEAVTSTATHLIEVGEVEPLSVAVERDLKDYFLRHYTQQVLRPQMRDRLIVSNVEAAARDAHERYLHSLAKSDLELQVFLSDAGRLPVRVAADERMTEIVLDWDAQRFNAPTYLMEDRAFDAVSGLGRVAVAGTIGAFALRPVIEAAAARGFGLFGRRVAAAMATRLAFAEGGAVAGTVTPVGPVGGAVIGGLIGLAADYAFNEANEAMSREAFVKANRDALDVTIATWQSTVEASLHAAIDVWYDDARDAIALQRLGSSD